MMVLEGGWRFLMSDVPLVDATRSVPLRQVDATRRGTLRGESEGRLPLHVLSTYM